MKYWRVELEPADAVLEGVVVAEDEDEADEKFNNDDGTTMFRFCPEQRSLRYVEIDESEYNQTKEYCEGR